MENYYQEGDLSDIVRFATITTCTTTSSSSSCHHHHSNMEDSISASANKFGDPFADHMPDPLLHIPSSFDHHVSNNNNDDDDMIIMTSRLPCDDHSDDHNNINNNNIFSNFVSDLSSNLNSLPGDHSPAATAVAVEPPPPGDCGLQISGNPSFKRRKKEVMKKVVCIPAPVEANSRTSGGEVVPCDLWGWRKYGQKPIKGSPYPRGYYRCSSSKGCLARKQVERSRTDPNMLVITYTSEHNHPWPTQRNALAGFTRSFNNTSHSKQQNLNVVAETNNSPKMYN